MTWRKEARRLCEAATPGPLIVERDDSLPPFRDVWRLVPRQAYLDRRRQNCSARPVYCATVYSADDAACLAAARTALPRALDALDAAEAALDSAEEWLADGARAYDEGLTEDAVVAKVRAALALLRGE